ncbi:hypothetical protein VMCG_07149 [Cytospora schulzeri]|uniref:Cytochrome P450 n=1 Tax=Cytospora schulzeri TaxID=448051 RepID=A0A423W526_9PEZI|nr:hypothetical protein VMCG_07149 [Valsa malicola]
MAAGLIAFLGDNLRTLPIGWITLSAFLLAVIIRLSTDPLRHVPGPLIARLTPLWLWYISYSGIECRTIAALHEKYGPVVRIAPSEVDISDGAVINPVYIKNGGFLKVDIYQHYDFDGFPTIFSGRNPALRASRAKAVAPMFATREIVKGRPIVQEVIDEMVVELRRRIAEASGSPLDVLNLFRALSIDITTAYLFGESFNGLGREKLSATAFVDNLFAGARFFYLPPWLYRHVDRLASVFDKERMNIAKSSAIVDEYVARAVTKSVAEKDTEAQTYQGRLLEAGISQEEIKSQLLDVVFAGTDPPAMALAKMCWYLTKLPAKYERVRQEVLGNTNLDASSLPYLSGVVKESLRLSMATPTRLPRKVPAGGFNACGVSIPAGTNVGIGAYSLHLNPEVFPNPHEFMPERWLESTPEMLRDSFSFGSGLRQCIARNLATQWLHWIAEALVRSDVLQGAKPVTDEIEVREWFNSKVIGGKIELVWK